MGITKIKKSFFEIVYAQFENNYRIKKKDLLNVVDIKFHNYCFKIEAEISNNYIKRSPRLIRLNNLSNRFKINLLKKHFGIDDNSEVEIDREYLISKDEDWVGVLSNYFRSHPAEELIKNDLDFTKFSKITTITAKFFTSIEIDRKIPTTYKNNPVSLLSSLYSIIFEKP